ncbi:glutathione S-transferase family protein [Motiliproteus sp. SC1-56]|uniref:glutathione S-transferase family protein n=1 Tax=Motiliproteus sp. SC1-56 TaxID=2799565 RepID=UPI001A8D0E6C|nr:glutathione S-transferase family protein [Motiliproteus sp. SC1-56]
MYRLIIGNKNYSSWSLRPWLLMQHLGIPFREERLALDTPDFQRQVSTYSGAGRVPVLVNDDQVIWDSLAICETLAEQFPNAWPKDPVARSHARAIVAEMHAGFGALRSELPMNCRAVERVVVLEPSVEADIRRIETIWRECLERYQGPWLFGAFSIADAFYAPVVLRFRGYRLPLAARTRDYMATQFESPHLQAWIAAGAAEAEVIPHEEVGD